MLYIRGEDGKHPSADNSYDMSIKSLICLSMFAMGCTAPIWADGSVASEQGVSEDEFATGMHIGRPNGRELVVVKRMDGHEDWYRMEFAYDEEKQRNVADVAEELRMFGLAYRYISRTQPGKPFVLVSSATRSAWLRCVCLNDPQLRLAGTKAVWSSRYVRASIREALCSSLTIYHPEISLGNFQLWLDGFSLSQDDAVPSGEMYMRFPGNGTALPSDGLFGISGDEPGMVLLHIRGYRPCVADGVYGNPSCVPESNAYRREFAKIMQCLEAHGIAEKDARDYLLYAENDRANGFCTYYLYPSNGNLPATPDEVRAHSRAVSEDDLRRWLAENVDVPTTKKAKRRGKWDVEAVKTIKRDRE